MHGNPFADADSDGCEFPIFHPDAGKSIAAGGVDAEVGTGGDEGVFDEAEVEVEVAATWVEIEDRVSGQLAGAVVGGLSAAVGFMDGMRQ